MLNDLTTRNRTINGRGLTEQQVSFKKKRTNSTKVASFFDYILIHLGQIKKQRYFEKRENEITEILSRDCLSVKNSQPKQEETKTQSTVNKQT